jgi:hypothetical protein
MSEKYPYKILSRTPVFLYSPRPTQASPHPTSVSGSVSGNEHNGRSNQDIRCQRDDRDNVSNVIL